MAGAPCGCQLAGEAEACADPEEREHARALAAEMRRAWRCPAAGFPEPWGDGDADLAPACSAARARVARLLDLDDAPDPPPPALVIEQRGARVHPLEWPLPRPARLDWPARLAPRRDAAVIPTCPLYPTTFAWSRTAVDLFELRETRSPDCFYPPVRPALVEAATLVGRGVAARRADDLRRERAKHDPGSDHG